MRKRLLVLDIDGTLANSRKEISDATKRAIMDAMKRGHWCMLASGRPLCGMAWAAQELSFEKYGGYLLAYNGAQIVKFDTMETICERKVPLSLLPDVYRFAVTNHCGLISYENNCIISANGIDEYIELEARINQMPIKEVDNFPEYFQQDVVKCLLCVDPAKAESLLEQLKQTIVGDVEIFRSEPFYIEIMPKGVDKASSIAQMLPKLGIAQEDVVACGDGFNDITMIRYAGVGVAMGNAQDALKAEADVITDTNDNDGLIPVIARFFD